MSILESTQPLGQTGVADFFYFGVCVSNVELGFTGEFITVEKSTKFKPRKKKRKQKKKKKPRKRSDLKGTIDSNTKLTNKLTNTKVLIDLR